MQLRAYCCGMKVLILGATGGTGRALVDQAIAQGHVVTAFARDPSKVRSSNPNLHIAKGNMLDPASVEAAVRGQDAVISALGVRINVWPLLAIILTCQLIARFAGLAGPVGWLVRLGVPLLAYLILFRATNVLSGGTKNIVQAMEKLGVKRFICESSLGVGDSKGQLGLLYTWLLIPVLLRGVFADKAVQEEIIKESSLDWVIVRPAALTNGRKTSVYKSGFAAADRSVQRRVSRADVAEFMLTQLTSDIYLRRTPGLSY